MSGPGVGFNFAARDISWNKRDTLLFALSIGAGIDELHLVFSRATPENDPSFQAFPTYANILPLKGTSQDVVDFGGTVISTPIPGVPEPKPDRIIDAHRAMTFYKPLPTSSEGKQFESQQTVLGVYDKGKAGTVLEMETVLREKREVEIYVKLVGSTFFIGQGDWGGSKGASPASFLHPQNRKPEGLRYIRRLSCRRYSTGLMETTIHVTEEQGKSMGFGGAIMHGLFTYNVAAYSVLINVARSDPQKLKHFSARFQAPVKPGDRLVTEIWKTGQVQDGFEDIRFLTKLEDGKIVLSNGRALIETSSSTRL